MCVALAKYRRLSLWLLSTDFACFCVDISLFFLCWLAKAPAKLGICLLLHFPDFKAKKPTTVCLLAFRTCTVRCLLFWPPKCKRSQLHHFRYLIFACSESIFELEETWFTPSPFNKTVSILMDWCFGFEVSTMPKWNLFQAIVGRQGRDIHLWALRTRLGPNPVCASKGFLWFTRELIASNNWIEPGT